MEKIKFTKALWDPVKMRRQTKTFARDSRSGRPGRGGIKAELTTAPHVLRKQR